MGSYPIFGLIFAVESSDKSTKRGRKRCQDKLAVSINPTAEYVEGKLFIIYDIKFSISDLIKYLFLSLQLRVWKRARVRKEDENVAKRRSLLLKWRVSCYHLFILSTHLITHPIYFLEDRKDKENKPTDPQNDRPPDSSPILRQSGKFLSILILNPVHS